MAERFIIYHFIPHSEALFSISEGLRELHAPDPSAAKADALSSFSQTWSEVQQNVLAAASSLLQKVQQAKQDISSPSAAGEARRLSALAKYAEKVLSKQTTAI